MEQYVQEKLENISKELAELANLPESWEKVYTNIVNGIELPFSFITEEDLAFTTEQQKKLEKLRDKRNLEIKGKQKFNSVTDKVKYGFSVDDPVFVVMKGVSFTGYVEEVIDNRTFYVSTPHGRMKIETKYDTFLKHRKVQDYSHIIIPESIQKMNTKQLLQALQNTRTWRYHGEGYGYNEVNFIKAELAKREHVPSKKEKKVVQQFLKK